MSQSAIRYIVSLRKQGIDDEIIRSKLVASGYPPSHVDSLFTEIRVRTIGLFAFACVGALTLLLLLAIAISANAPVTVTVGVDNNRARNIIYAHADEIMSKYRVALDVVTLQGTPDNPFMVPAKPGTGEIYTIESFTLSDFIRWNKTAPLEGDLAPAAAGSVVPLYMASGTKEWVDYGIPVSGDIMMLYYRRDLFEDPGNRQAFLQRYGHELAPPKDWAQYLEVAEFMNETGAGQHYGVAEFWTDGQAYPFLERYVGMGGKYFDKDMKFLPDRDIAVKALQNLRASATYAAPLGLMPDYVNYKNLIAQGKVAMLIAWPEIGKAHDIPTEASLWKDVGYAAMPSRSLFSTRLVVVNPQTRHPRQVGEVLRFITSPEITKALTVDTFTGYNPVSSTLISQPDSFKTFSSPEHAAQYLAAIQDSIAQGYPIMSITGSNFLFPLLDPLLHSYVEGNLTEDEFLMQADAAWAQVSKGQADLQGEWETAIQDWRRSGVTLG